MFTFTLITGRTLEQGRNLEIGKFSKGYLNSVAVCEMAKEDMEKLGIKDGSNVKVKTAYGEVVVKAVTSASTTPGIIFIPMGAWANMVVNPNSQGSGMPTLKGIPATVEPTSEQVSALEDLISMFHKKPIKIDFSQISPPSSTSTASGEYNFKDVVCCFCGCVCDDLEVVVKDSTIKSVKNACAIGMAKLLNYNNERVYKPMIRKNGKLVEVSLEEAIEAAANILVNAKYPILYGWSSTSNEAMRLGVRLAELVGGVVDNTSVICHGPTVLGTQQVGVVTATLGQIRNRADLIIFWGCNPLHAHPRHTVRYSAMAKGWFIKGRKERKIIIVDVRPSPTSRIADLFIQVKPGRDYELITALRMAIKDHTIEAEEVAGVPRDKILQMADMLRSAKFGVLFFGMGLTMTTGKGRNIEEAIKLVQDLNEWTKFVILPMRGHFNVAGTNAVMAWLTGFPYAIDLSLGYPRHNPGLTSSTDILIRGDADAALIIASDPASHFPQQAIENLTRIPVIVIDPRWSLTSTIADVIIPTAFVGIEVDGVVYRMDGVPLKAKSIVKPPPGILSDEEVLKMNIKKVEEKKFGG
ncbi:formylmethanofuran dehydrogenase subunit B [Candidatus Bathyarchaeota archaeon]|nr:MAG: formylmethanofuran dehydrogenase subunit B [Candidatus Bathyarchaeota archaeon]